jgi:membrane protein YqaA with SNARE-associated domain
MIDANIFDLFVNSLLGNFILPLQDEIIWFSLLAFQPGTMALPSLVAILASSLGLLTSYGLGRLVARDRRNMPLPEKNYQKASCFCESYLVWLLLIPWIPLLGILVLVLGFLHVPLKRLLPCILLGRIFYYGYYLFMG